MSTIRNPVGPLPPSVYWRRRLTVGLGLVAVIIVIVLIVVRPGSGATPAPTPTPSASSSTAAGSEAGDSEAAAGADGVCDPSVIRLTAVTDAASYASGVQPLVSMIIENAGAVACQFDVGTAAQEYVITSGSDRIWSSRDCQSDGTSTLLTLEPQKPLSTTPFAWDRTRSATDTCDATRPEVVAGGASYHLEVRLGDVVSESTQQFLLN